MIEYFDVSYQTVLIFGNIPFTGSFSFSFFFFCKSVRDTVTLFTLCGYQIGNHKIIIVLADVGASLSFQQSIPMKNRLNQFLVKEN